MNFRRQRGLPAPPGYWRDGEPAGEHRWVIDGDLFVEVDGAPPWTVDPGDGGPEIRCEPDGERGVATVERRGASLDGARGDLVVAQRPAARHPFWRRLFKTR